MSEWTSGPWRVSRGAQRRVTSEHGVVICNAVLRNQGGPKAKTCLKSEHEAEANAALIAAAPEMYAALERIADLYRGKPAHGIARTALAKARGELTPSHSDTE